MSSHWVKMIPTVTRVSPLLSAFAIITVLVTFSIKRWLVNKKTSAFTTTRKGYNTQDIIALQDFKWHETEPLKLRPFKPKYHLTMALENISVSELIEMDKNYFSRVQIRDKIMKEKTKYALAATDAAKPAVDEAYTWLLSTYLPTRFPLMFQIRESSSKAASNQFQNLVTGKSYPLAPPSEPVEALRIFGSNIDEDILILLPSEDGDGYTLQAFVNCFPAGFDTSKKWLMKLRDLHKPVPGYKEKLERSMDRYFDKLEVGKFVKRTNWSITTTSELFIIGDHHLSENEEVPEKMTKELDMNNVFVRCERQTLYRLPQTKAVVFSFKTYLYPIADIKAEGLGEELATAIDGLKLGNVPAMNHYKRGVVWGDSVKDFLRS